MEHVFIVEKMEYRFKGRFESKYVIGVYVSPESATKKAEELINDYAKKHRIKDIEKNDENNPGEDNWHVFNPGEAMYEAGNKQGFCLVIINKHIVQD